MPPYLPRKIKLPTETADDAVFEPENWDSHRVAVEMSKKNKKKSKRSCLVVVGRRELNSHVLDLSDSIKNSGVALLRQNYVIDC